MTSVGIKKLEKALKASGKMRDFNWVVEQYKKKRLYINGYKLNTKNKFEQYRLLIKLVSDIYENEWDIDFSLLPDGQKIRINILGPEIHFPEVRISNSRGSTARYHTIRDLFVRINLRLDSRSSNLMIGGLYGGRSTFTMAEVSSDYSHSHISGTGIYNGYPVPFYSGFCTGSGHINDYIAEINAGEVTEQNLTRFLVQIMSLVSWESTEGGPYRRIANITLRTNNGSRLIVHQRYADDLYTQIIRSHKNNDVTPNLEFILENGKYKLLDNDKFERFLRYNGTPFGFTDTQLSRYLCVIDESGTAWQLGRTPTITSIRQPNSIIPFIFRGEEKTLVIDGTPESQNTEATVIRFHPEYKQYIKQQIEYDVNKKSIRKSTIDRYTNQTDNAREGIESDTVFMQEDS